MSLNEETSLEQTSQEASKLASRRGGRIGRSPVYLASWIVDCANWKQKFLYDGDPAFYVPNYGLIVFYLLILFLAPTCQKAGPRIFRMGAYRYKNLKGTS